MVGALATPVINVVIQQQAPVPVLSNVGDLIPVPFGGTSGADCRFGLACFCN